MTLWHTLTSLSSRRGHDEDPRPRPCRRRRPTRYRPIIKLHGCIDKPDSMVWTRTGYRKLTNTLPEYLGFLRYASKHMSKHMSKQFV